MSSKKKLQLGMNPSTATSRITKDLLFKFAIQLGYTCFRCGKDLNREDFSIDHKISWLDSEDPVGLFFDLNNIAFSHHGCNARYTKNFGKTKYPEYIGYSERRPPHKVANDKSRFYDPEKRRAQYLRTGK